MALIKLSSELEISKYSPSWICPVFSLILEQVSIVTSSEQKLDFLCNCKSEISNVCNVVEAHCLQAKKIVHHDENRCFDWLICEQQSVNPSREAISILSGKHKRFAFVHPVVRANSAVRILLV